MTLPAQVSYLQSPADVVNESLDMIGCPEKVIGDITDGTAIAECARRNYGQLLRGLLRTAHWTFARKQAALTLLADATGNTANVSTTVDWPWTYAYAWPIDGVAARWMPIPPPQVLTTPPQTTGASSIYPGNLFPGRFLVSSSGLYPIEVGNIPWDQIPDLQRTEGVGPVTRRVILTDMPGALFVYTRLVTVIEEWDPLFRQAMDCLLALALIPVAIDDPKERLVQRNSMIGIAKNAIADARVANGNDAGYPQSVDHQPVWITARSGGLWPNGGTDGLSGATFYPWDASFSFSGSVF